MKPKKKPVDELDALVEEIKALVRRSPYKLFKLEVGDMESKQTFTNSITWEDYIRLNRSPSSYTSRTRHSMQMEFSERD